MVCTSNPPGLEVHWLLNAQAKDSQTITLKGFGFLPREKLIIKIEGTGPQNAVVIGTSDYAVGEDGSFSGTEALPLDDPVMQWKAYVIHQRGTACFQFETKR